MNSFIKSLMDEKALTQKELAEILGISAAAVSQWRDECFNIGLEKLFALSKLFHVTVDELIEGKRTGESLEDKWKRKYYINPAAAKAALVDGKTEKVLKYFDALYRANNRFFELFEKKISGEITDNGLKEWEYLKQFYKVDYSKSNLLLNETFDFRVAGNLQETDKKMTQRCLQTLIEKIGLKNMNAIIWELQKIYRITYYGVKLNSDFEVVPYDDYYNDYGDNPLEYLKEDEDKEVSIAVYKTLSPIEKDMLLTKMYHASYSYRLTNLYSMIKYGGHILYLPNDLNTTNYDYKDLVELEGETPLIPVEELDNAQAVIYDVYDNYMLAGYEQYRALINFERSRQIEMAAEYKEKNPVKYWEYIKSVEVLI